VSRVIVVGAGAMGLAAAYWAAKAGHEVKVIEAAPDPGGMAGHFDFDGVSIERFYHFVCRSDAPTFLLLKELGLQDKMIWRSTSMGLYTEKKLHTWGNPIALLRVPFLGVIDKIRYALFAFVCIRRDSWPALEHESAKRWIVRWCGASLYKKLWKPLFDLKFYEYADNISAAWIWTRIRRIGRSRKSMFQEELGYIEGGSLTLVNALISGIKDKGGQIYLREPVQQVTVQNGCVTGVRTVNHFHVADAVICTVPTPLISKLLPDLPVEWTKRYDAIHNIGVICVIFKLAQSVTPHFWVNISDPEIEIPGVIEFTNLRPIGSDVVVYVPYYMPATNKKFSWPDQQLIDEAFSCLQHLNGTIERSSIRATKVARLLYGQPICEPEFSSKIPPTKTPIAGLQIADTCFYYPEDRGIAESVRLGQELANDLGVSTVSVGDMQAWV